VRSASTSKTSDADRRAERFQYPCAGLYPRSGKFIPEARVVKQGDYVEELRFSKIRMARRVLDMKGRVAAGIMGMSPRELSRGERIDAVVPRQYEKGARMLLNFSEPPHTEAHILSASDLLRMSSAEGWQSNPTFRDGIVMVGGIFVLSGDVSYKTPVSTRAGVQLFSDAIETELQGRPITPLNELLMVMFEIVGGYLLAAWHFVSKNWSAVVFRVAAVPVLAIASSLLAFSSLAYWASFVPVLVGVLLHEMHQHFSRYRTLIKRAREMDIAVRRLQKQRRHR